MVFLRLNLPIFIYFSFFVLLSHQVFAAGSGSFRDEVPDAGAFGMGSAFVGESDTPAAIYYNPAGINQMKRPTVTFGDTVIAPREKYTSTTGVTVNERVKIYNIPNFYAVVPVTPGKLTVGIGSGSYWGLGENWASDSALRYATTQATLKNIDNSLVVAYQITDQWSLAASADNDYSKADESKEFSNLGNGPDGDLKLRAGDNAWGYRLATMFKLNDQNQFGLMYRSRINHNYQGKIMLNGISPALQGLFGFSSSSFIANVEEKSVLPQSVILGYSLKPAPKWTINADLEWMDWSSTKYQTLTFYGANAQQLGFLSNGNPVPQNWHSAWSESIGAQYAATDRLRLRLGYYHHEKVIPSDTFSPVIPDSSSNGYTTGFGFDITKRLTIDVAYSLAVYDTRRITNAVLNTFGGVNGKYEVYLNIALVSFSYKF